MNYQTVLFSTDFSDRDQAAFSAACDLALKAGARLLVLHVQDPRYPAQSKATRKDPNVEFTRYVPEDLGVNFDHVVKVGDPAEQILNVAEQENVNIIVLGTHGRSGLSRAFAGSVAEKVLRNADAPVMTVRDSVTSLNRHDTPRVLVPVDFSVYGYAAMDYATKLALAIGAEISIVHVDESDTAVADQFSNSLPEWNDYARNIWGQLKTFAPSSEKVNVTHKLLKGDAATAISDYANGHNFDFIVLGTHGRSGLGRAIMGSVAESVVRNSNCSVIAVKPTNKRTSVLRPAVLE